MTWIKICGITNLEDALTAVDAGADAVGFVFYEKSPRKVKHDDVRSIVARLPERIDKVGVFVEESADQVREIVRQTGLTAAQIYNTKCAMALRSYQESESEPPAKVIFVFPGNKLVDGSIFFSADFRHVVFALMVDSGSAGQLGGTGQLFDWVATQGIIRSLKGDFRTIIAGGLSSSNVTEALTTFTPWGVDVASGVEAVPGRKDPAKVRAFVQAVRAAEKGA